MKERPILFSAPMVRAILEGRKTMTRRVVKGSPVYVTTFIGRDNLPTNEYGFHSKYDRVIDKSIRCPYGQPGDRLWVRETWSDSANALAAEAAGPVIGSSFIGSAYEYAADYPERGTGWRPSIFMPRWASRILLEVSDIRVERVQNISEEDAKAEGAGGERYSGQGFEHCIHREAFRTLWDSINAKRGYGWDANPWVWVVSFKPAPDAGDATKERE